LLQRYGNIHEYWTGKDVDPDVAVGADMITGCIEKCQVDWQ
jgi:hypothetical protein